MKIKSITKRSLSAETPVYDVVDAAPFHNFLINTPESAVIAHNCGLLDEVDFVGGASERMEKSKVMKVYNGVKRRMESRYMRHGELPGVLFLVSSKKSEHDFLEQYSATQKDNENVLIIDEPIWKVKPSSNYSGVTFPLAVGNKYVKSKIIGPNEDVESYRKQGYRILDVPVEHKESFDLDMDSALMDIAGISMVSTTKFISYDRLKRNYTDRINPFKMEILTIGLDDNLAIRDFFVPDMVSQGTRAKPGFIHIDTSLTGDKTGISYVIIDGTKKVGQYKRDSDSGEAEVREAIDLVFKQIFTIGIAAPSDSEISFEKTRQFIYYLRSIGFNIQGVSVDGFQSRDTVQQLKTAGYKSEVISLDRTPTGYHVFKAAINEERLNLCNLDQSTVEHEIIDLEADGLSGKIDHPVDGCFTEDTLIRTADEGELSISDLLKDQEDGITHTVFTVNERTWDIEIKPIKKVFYTKTVSNLITLVFDNGKKVRCTPDHKFMLDDGTYCEAKNIKPNSDALRTSMNSVRFVNYSAKKSGCNEPVYDLEIEDNHNFALGSGVIVHNSKDLSDSLCGAIYNASLYKLADNIRHASADTQTMLHSLISDTLSSEKAMLGAVESDYVIDDKTKEAISRTRSASMDDIDLWDLLDDGGSGIITL